MGGLMGGLVGGGAGNKYYMTGSAEGIFWTAIKMNDISCAPDTMKNRVSK